MNKTEKEKLRKFITKYQEIDLMLNTMQKSIESLAKKRDLLFEELETLQTAENEFLTELIQKYGASKITPHTLLQICESTEEE